MIRLPVATHQRQEMLDITREVRLAVRESKITEGIALVFVPHTTAGITIQENADPDVTRDLLMETSRLVPFEDGYAHCEGNSAAHIKATLFGSSVQLIVSQGEVLLGTWQGIYFCEFDGPRRREVWVQVVGTHVV